MCVEGNLAKLDTDSSDIEVDEKRDYSHQLDSLTTDDEINSVLFQLPQNLSDISASKNNAFMAKSNTQLCPSQQTNSANNKSTSLCSSPVIITTLNRSNSGCGTSCVAANARFNPIDLLDDEQQSPITNKQTTTHITRRPSSSSTITTTTTTTTIEYPLRSRILRHLSSSNASNPMFNQSNNHLTASLVASCSSSR